MEPEESANKESKAGNAFVKYMGAGFQMLCTIGLLAFIGHKIDIWQATQKPLYTAFLGLLGVLIGIYMLIKDLNKK